jgi:hypothetical protein
MNLTLPDQLKQFLRVLQGALFPTLPEELGPLTEKHQQVVAALNRIHLEAMIASPCGGVGRPLKDRRAIARAFVAKAVYNFALAQWAARGSCWNDWNVTLLCGGSAAGRASERFPMNRSFRGPSPSLPRRNFRSDCMRRSSKRPKRTG